MEVNVYDYNVEECVGQINDWLSGKRSNSIHVIIRERSENTVRFLKTLRNHRSWVYWIRNFVNKGVVTHRQQTISIVPELLECIKPHVYDLVVPDGDMFTFVCSIDHKTARFLSEEEMSAAGVPRSVIDVVVKLREVEKTERAQTMFIKLQSAKVPPPAVNVIPYEEKVKSPSRIRSVIKAVIDTTICAAASYGVYTAMQFAF